MPYTTAYRFLFHQAKADTATVQIDRYDSHLDMLMELQDLRRVCHALYSHLGCVDEAVLLDSYVYESSKGSDIGHDTWEFHSGLEVFH